MPAHEMAGHAREGASHADEEIRRRGQAPRLWPAAVIQFGIGAQFAMGEAQALLADVDLVTAHERDHCDGRRMVKADIALGNMGVCPVLDADQLGSDPIR